MDPREGWQGDVWAIADEEPGLVVWLAGELSAVQSCNAGRGFV
ncbi:MAG: hypothetical protein RLZZ232_3043 [Planctomycetota bacterium]|jgi:hypothetical protein